MRKNHPLRRHVRPKSLREILFGLMLDDFLQEMLTEPPPKWGEANTGPPIVTSEGLISLLDPRKDKLQ